MRSRFAVTAGAVALALLVTGCEGRAPHGSRAPAASASASAGAPEPSAPSKASPFDGPMVVEIDLEHGAPETRSSSLLGSSSRRSYADLVRALRALGDGGNGTATAKGVFVHLGGASIGLARAEEIGTLLGNVRRQRPVVCHADEYENTTMMLAALGCSRIWVSPAGGVETVGIAAHLIFANRLLSRLNVGVDFLQVGKYKGAQEPFTRDGPSPEARESLEGTLHGLRAAWLAHVAAGRGKLSTADAVEDGPFAPGAALERGLVDAVGYLDEARDEAKSLSGAERVVTRFGTGNQGGNNRGIVGMLRAIAGSGRSGVPRVAILPAVGSITMNPSTSLLGSNDGITEREMGREIGRLTGDDSVKAVVLRMDSPGGSALASDLLWKRLRKLAAAKPLVVSVGDMAASGGYYLSCAGTKIVAEPTSIVGSIGVVGGKLALGKALDELGVHAETIPAAPDPKKAARAGYMSNFQAWDDPTRERVLDSMKAVYDLFVRRVAEGRGTTVDVIAPAAEGRIFGGVEAKERGLVDDVGGLSDAIDLAIKLAGLPKDAPVEIDDEPSGLIELLEKGEIPGGGDASGESAAAVAQRAAREALLPPGWSTSFPGAGALVGSLSPLLGGERALTTLPFGVAIK